MAGFLLALPSFLACCRWIDVAHAAGIDSAPRSTFPELRQTGSRLTTDPDVARTVRRRRRAPVHHHDTDDYATPLTPASSATRPSSSTAKQIQDPQRKQAVEEGTDIVYQAVIIGAGWAGLGAANALRDLKNGTFLVLEGRDYVGGRSRTVRFSSTGARVELGSGWIHGATDENPIFEIAESSGMGALPSPEGYRIWSDSYQDDLPHPVSLDDVEPVIETVTGGFAEFLDNYPEDDPEDVPLRDAADEYVQEEGIAGDTELVFEFALDSEIVAEYAASLEDLSRWWWNEDGGKPGDDAVVGNGGYSGAIDWYAQGILDRIVLNANVTAIDWSDSLAVSVTYTQGGVERTANADNVIVTLPLGVLKRGTVSFIPELPREKQDAINRLEMGLLNKCIMQWDSDDTLPWPSDIGWFQKIAPLGEQGKWTEFFSLQWESGQKIVIAWSAGREAVRVEQLSDDEIKEEVMASFASMFGEGVVPTPKDWIISRWLMDPWSRGSYSYYAVGSSPADRQSLASPIDDRIFFAGEATHTTFMSTTHGALDSGVVAAKLVMEKLAASGASRFEMLGTTNVIVSTLLLVVSSLR